MFRDTHAFETLFDSATTAWDVAGPAPSIARAAPAGQDEVGAVWHIYREIERRIARNAYTRHASTLGKAGR